MTVLKRLNVATDLRSRAEKAIAAAREAAKIAEEAKARAREAELRLDAVAKVTRGITSAALADQIQRLQNSSSRAASSSSGGGGDDAVYDDASALPSKTPQAKLPNGPHSFSATRKTKKVTTSGSSGSSM